MTVDIKKYSGKLHWFHWLIVIASLVLTVFAWYFAQAQVEQRAENRFKYESARIQALVGERMEKYEDALWAGVAAIQSQSHGIDYLEWKRFSAALQIQEKYPGINGIGVIYNITPKELEEYLAEQQVLRPNFKIHPPHNEKEFFPITYIEPVEINKAAVGLDMAHENNRYMAAKKSRDTGTAQITGPITLVQDAKKTPGFLFYVPFYNNSNIKILEDRQKNFIGLVYAPFIFKKLIDGTLQREQRLVGIKISDAEEILYDENHSGDDTDFDPEPVYQTSVTVPMYGRNWQFDIQTKQSFRDVTTNSKPWMILIGGIVIDGLLLSLFLFLAKSNHRAAKLADQMSKNYQASAAQLDSVITQAVDGFITIDTDGIVRSYNPACEKMFGYKSSEVIGQNVKMLMPDPYHNEHDQYLHNYHKTEDKKIIGIGREVEGKRKDGLIFPIDLSVSENLVNEQKFYSGIIRDLTKQKEAERKVRDTLNFQNLVTSSIPDFIFVKDSQYRLVQANPSFLSLYPQEMRDSIIGTTTLESYKPEEREEFLKFDKKAFEEGFSETEETISCPDGKTRTLLTKKVRFENDEQETFILGVATDITLLKKGQKERENLINKLTESNTELERFAYIASHDLQEPLRMITNYTERLSAKYADQLDDKAQKYIHFAYDGAMRMQELINDLLEYSRLGQETERYETIDLNKSMRIVINNLEEAIQKTNAKVSFDGMPTVLANPVRIARLLQNLIGNSIKYSEENTQPIIHVHCQEKTTEWLFSVSDNGIGIKTEYLTQIFDTFKRLHTTQHYSGTGIGLAVCKKIVETRGGKIWAESKYGEGSTFLFTLPKLETDDQKGTI